jgi:hypothetical protein
MGVPNHKLTVSIGLTPQQSLNCEQRIFETEGFAPDDGVSYRTNQASFLSNKGDTDKTPIYLLFAITDTADQVLQQFISACPTPEKHCPGGPPQHINIHPQRPVANIVAIELLLHLQVTLAAR